MRVPLVLAVAFGLLDVLLVVSVPATSWFDPRLPRLHRIALLITEGLLAAGVAFVGLALVSLLPRSPRRPGARLLVSLGRGTLVATATLALLVAFGLLVTVRAFPDEELLPFVAANAGQLLRHVVASNPWLVLAGIVVAATASGLSELGFRRVPTHDPASRMGAWIGGVTASCLLLFAIGANLTMPHESLPVTARDGRRTSLGSAWAESRAHTAGPLLHLLLADGERGARGGTRDRGGRLPPATPCIPVVPAVDFVRQARAPLRRPNFVVILVESLRPDALVSFGGVREAMPSVDALARRSVRFQRAYAQATHSDYSDPCPLSSQFPLRSPRHSAYERLDYPRVLVYDLLKQLGYRTAIISSQNEEWSGMASFLDTGSLDLFFHAQTAPEDATIDHDDEGFARWATALGRAGKLDDHRTIDRVIRWVDDGPEPFFVYVNLQTSHFPYRTPRDFAPRFKPDEVDFPFLFGAWPRDKTPVVVNRYLNSLAYVDEQIGRLLHHLRSTRRMDDTVIVVTGDTAQAFFEHGWAGHGGPPFDEVARVPLILFVPGVDPRDVLHPVQHVDVPPTFLSLMGLPPFPGFQGEDLLRGGARSPVFVISQPPGWFHAAVVTQRHKLIRDYRGGGETLFDLQTDPAELRDLSRELPSVRSALGATLDRFVDGQLDYYGSRRLTARCFAPSSLHTHGDEATPPSTGSPSAP